MKIKKILSFIIVLIIILNFSLITFANVIDVEYSKIEKLGESFGYYDGFLRGFIHYTENSQASYYEERPLIEEVIEKHIDYLENRGNTYQNHFLSGYYTGFEKGYNDALEDGSTTRKVETNTKYTDFADILGLLTGEIFGYKDFYADKNLNASQALPSDKVLIQMFNLNKFDSQERYSFLNIFKQKFKQGYQEGFKKANFVPIRTSYEEGISHGEYFGKILGKTSGAKDYFQNKTRKYQRHIPLKSTIIKEYSLNKDGEKYREGFLIGFERAYEESYNENFRTMNIDEHRRSYEKGYEQGIAAGRSKGEVRATGDYYLKLENNWRRYFPTESDLIREYSLSIESTIYRESFFSGYIDGFAQGYGTKFQELSQQTIKKKSSVEQISISGGEINSLDNSFTLKIDKGTYYNSVVVIVDILPNDYNSIDSDFIKASNFYSVDIINKSNEADNEKEIELKFEYYGKDNGGIYKLVNDEWLYLPSYIEDGYIKSYIKPSSIKEKANIYSVLVDKNVEVLLDIRNHWAKEEITAYYRRGIVSGYSNNTFKPDKNISKGEFLTILSRVYNWELTDEGVFSYKDIINYAIDKDYVDESILLNHNERITYREVESIMEKVIDSKEFKWHNFSSKILYEKQYKSESYKDMNNFISRAEVVYMLYTLNEWRY